MNHFPSQITFPGGIVIDLMEREGVFHGIGAVQHGGTTLRSGQRPMFVEIRNPSAIELTNYRLVACEQSAGKAVLRFAMDWREGGAMEWMVHEVRQRYATGDWTRGPQPAEGTVLELELRPVQRQIAGRRYQGFSYRYHYRSQSIPIYRILDRGTWEIGGSALGNEFWMRSCFVPSIVAMESAGQAYSTEWYLPDCANPSVLQFMPLQTELQGFTFTASSRGVLVTWSPEVSHVRSLFEKRRGDEVLAHFHEHCGDLAHEFSSAPVEVLWSPGARNRVELANDYDAVRELVHETLHAQIGMRRERVSTYGQIEEWESVDIERYRTLGLPKLLAAGTRTVYLANLFQNHMNTWGISNFCVTVDYKVAESVGQDKLRAFCRDAKAGGATVQMWGNTAISTLTLMFDTRQGSSDRLRFLPREGSIMDAIDPRTCFVRNASNAIDADHYTPVFAVLNLRDPAVREYWLRCWKAAHNDVGLSSIFLDSSCNLSSDKFHYVQNTEAHIQSGTSDQTHLLGFHRPAKEPQAAILSQYRAMLDLMVQMQRLGYIYGNEDIGVFGIHRHGPGLAMRLDNLFLWSDCIASFEPAAIRSAGGEAEDVYFRALAYRMMWAIHWDVQKDQLSFHAAGVRSAGDIPSERHLALLRAYNQVEGLMLERTILPHEDGVLYSSPAGKVLWAFKDLELPLEEAESALDVLHSAPAEGPVARRHHIYVIRAKAAAAGRQATMQPQAAECVVSARS